MKLEKQPMAEYLSDPGIGSGQLKTILDSPRDYQFSLKAPKKESAAQSKGTLWHTYILERDLYHEQHIIQPEDWGSLVENPGRKKWAEFKEKAKQLGKIPIKYKDAADLLLLDEVIDSHNDLQVILGTHKAEVSFYAELDGIRLKSREDLWSPDEDCRMVWDVKTTSKDLDDETIARTIFDNGYHFSAAHHMKVMELAGYPCAGWGWIFVSTSTPCPHIVIKRASRELLEYGETDWKYAFDMLKDCKEKNSWPGYDEEILEIGLPDWIERKYYNGL